MTCCLEGMWLSDESPTCSAPRQSSDEAYAQCIGLGSTAIEAEVLRESKLAFLTSNVRSSSLVDGMLLTNV